MKTTLEVNGNNGPGISFEQIQYNSLIEDKIDEMHGDQLFGHPIIKEIEQSRNKSVPVKETGNKSIDVMFRNFKKKFGK